MSAESTPTPQQQQTPQSPLLAGRWQIPLAVAALGLCIYAGMKLGKKPEPLNFEQALTDLRALEAGDRAVAAADAAQNLLALQPPLSSDQEALIYDFLANLTYRQERERLGEPSAENLKRLLEFHEQAVQRGLKPSAGTAMRAAFAAEQLNEEDRADAAYREAIELAVTPAERRVATWRLARRLGHKADQREQQTRLVAELLDDPALPPGYAWWALRDVIGDALRKNEPSKARESLAQYADPLKGSDYAGFIKFFDGLITLAEGRAEEAEPVAAWVAEWCDANPRQIRAMAKYGHLPTHNRFLSGKIHLALSRYPDAVADFESVIADEPLGDLVIPAHIGRLTALAMQNGHREAEQGLDRALARLAKLSPGQAADMLEQIIAALRSLHHEFENREDYGVAARYLERAFALEVEGTREVQLDISEAIGKAYTLGADAASDDDARRAMREKAGEWLEKASRLVRFDDNRQAALSWQAIQQYDRGGRLHDARRLLEALVADRLLDNRRSIAMLQLGRVCEALSDHEAALRWYQSLSQTYPQLEEAARAEVLSAGMLIQLGEARYEEAQAALDRVLLNGRVSPQSSAFRDAHALASELLYRRSRYADAIASFEEFLDRYPNDAERGRARFLLANCYRRSAHQLRDNPPSGASPEAAELESKRRLLEAATRFQQLIDDLPGTGISGATAETYRRLAMFYIADCRLEMNDPESQTAALMAYRGIAARYESHPASLVAQVQIANLYLRQGNVDEAARAVERARWLLRAMSDESLSTSGSGATRPEWERYLATVASSNLFRGELADAR